MSNGPGCTLATGALKRLYGWIRECVLRSEVKRPIHVQERKFKNEIGEYFDKDFLLTYYIFTDFFPQC